jgi:hypothetical protein
MGHFPLTPSFAVGSLKGEVSRRVILLVAIHNFQYSLECTNSTFWGREGALRLGCTLFKILKINKYKRLSSFYVIFDFVLQ